MTKEQKFLLSVLADHINQRKTKLDDFDNPLDWEQLMTYAQNHQIEGILFHQCKEFLPQNIAARLSQLYASNLFYYSNRVRLYKQIEAELTSKEIAFYPVKGLEIAKLYPVPALRTMGDCDIVVHPQDKQNAHETMLELGFENDLQQDMEWTYFKNKLEFEIHDHLLYDETVNSQISKDFTALAWEYARKTSNGTGYELDWNFHFVFLLLHLKKHFLNSGVGFRQFMDLVVVTQYQPLDWDWLNEMLTKLELLEFAKNCCAFCERWFDVKMPLTATLDEDFFEKSTQKVFGNGIFGFSDETNRENANLNQIQYKGKGITLLERVFPTYDNVKYVPHYSFVVGRPWLLPVVWVYRLFRSIFVGKANDGVKMINTALNSDNALEKRKDLLSQWGL